MKDYDLFNGAATTTDTPSVLTMEMVQEMADMVKSQKMIALNPYVRLPADNEMTVADEKKAGTLPGNVMISKHVPLLTAYVFDKSLLEFPRDIVIERKDED